MLCRLMLPRVHVGATAMTVQHCAANERKLLVEPTTSSWPPEASSACGSRRSSSLFVSLITFVIPWAETESMKHNSQRK